MRRRARTKRVRDHAGSSTAGRQRRVADRSSESPVRSGWTGLIWAPRSISFGIVCAVLYALAYKPILRILEARRQQIAAGLANAEKIKAELARIEVERQDVLTQAGAEGKQLIDEARAAAARVQAEETQKAIAAAEQILVRAHETAERERAQMLAELKREVGRLVVQTTASVTGKILTADDQRRLAEETATATGAVARRAGADDEGEQENRARAARRLFRLCRVDGRLDAERVRLVAQRIAGSGRRGTLAILGGLAEAGAARSRRGTARSSRAPRRFLTTCASTSRPASPASTVEGSTRRSRSIPRSSAACASGSAATSTTAACGPSWPRSKRASEIAECRQGRHG